MSKLPILAISAALMLAGSHCFFITNVNAQTVTPLGSDDSDGTYDVFYDQLTDDGHWYEDENYGYVFQPAVASDASDWRPYADGHWVSTDRGWCWVSNERFGWACYHYGRWVRLIGTGWVWIPGHVWAPAWVSWRQSDEYVGWAPLPPECDDSPSVHVSTWCDRYYDIGPAAFCFVAFRDWARPSYSSYIAPVQNNVTIINRTTNITNIVYNNQVVNNYGPQAQVLSQRLGQPIQQYHLNYVANPKNPNRFATTAQGNQLQVVAPAAQLRPTASVQPPVQNRLGRAQVDRGWHNVNPAQATQLRAQLAKETSPPASLPAKPLPPAKPQFIGSGSPTRTAAPVRPATEATNGTPEHKPVSSGGVNPGQTSGAIEQKPVEQGRTRSEASPQKQAELNSNAPTKTPEVREHPQGNLSSKQAATKVQPHTAEASHDTHPSHVPPQSHPAQVQHKQETTHPASHPVNHPPAHAAPATHPAPHPSGAEHGHAPASGHGPGGSHPSQSHPAATPGRDEKKKHA